MSNRTANWFPLLLALAVAGGMILGYFIQGRYNQQGPSLISLGKQTKLEEILGYIHQKYVEDIDSDQLSDAAIEQVLEQLDPHSIYISRSEMQAIREDMTGNFEGIGIEFFIVSDTVMVVTPLSGGPSEELGISSGDKIVMIDDSLVAGIGITNSQVVKLLKGRKGTEVKVGIKRAGVPELIDYTIVRDKIPIVSVDVGYKVEDGIGYIKINRFSANTYREFMAELEELKSQEVTRLILDLRQNPGGYLDEATKILDEFIDGRKELVYTQGRQHPKFTYNARKPGIFEEGEVIILIDEGSASASEIIAGSIQDWDRGRIIGRRSFGKGLVQEQYTLEDGSALRLTVAKYYTPSGRCIQKSYGEGHDSYDMDINKRFESGELFTADSIHVVDSLIYYTKVERRKVYGGGGIMPDIFIPYDTLGYDEYFGMVTRRGLIRQFAYDYYADNKPVFEAFSSAADYLANFAVDDRMMDAFYEYASVSAGISRPGTMDPLVVRNLKNRLKASFAKQSWNGDGYFPVLLEYDPIFEAAVNVFHQSLAVE